MDAVIEAVNQGIKGVHEKLSAELKSGLAAQESKLNSALTELAQNGTSLKGLASGAADSFGAQVVKQFDENRDLFEKTRSVRLEIKAAGDAVTTASGRNVVNAGMGFVQGGVLGIQNALPTRSQGSTTAVEYSRFTGVQGAAAQQVAEGDKKASIRPDHTIITQSGLTIAGTTRMSRQALSDSAELRKCVETTLARSVATVLDTALATGATGFAGGLVGLATAYTSLVYDNLVDAISEGVATMQTAGFAPNTVVMSPADWLAITVAKGTSNDHYLSGNYLGGLTQEMRGLKVVLSPSIAAGKALLMDTQHADLLVVDNFQIELAYSADDFERNLITARGELRVIPIFRTAGSARLITPAA